MVTFLTCEVISYLNENLYFRYCLEESTPFIKSTKGTMILTNSVCRNGHISIWRSQPSHNKLPTANLMTAAAILCSGSNPAKVLNMFRYLNVQMFTIRTYNRLQNLYVVPAATMTWDSEQAQLLQSIQHQDVVVGGDARCDSPGYSAKYGSYTMMNLETQKILDFQLIQVRSHK